MDNYATVQQVTNYLNRSLTSQESAILPTALAAASRWIDRTLGTYFGKLDPVTGISARQFRGGYRNINIDPCQGITAIQAISPYDNSVWYTYSTPLEYIAEPYNNVVKTYLVLRLTEFTDMAGDNRKWPGGEATIRVTGLFTEYDYVNDKYPDDIVMLVTHLSAVWLQNSIRADGIVREQIEGHLIMKGFEDMLKTDPIVCNVIEARQEIWLED